jgi:hypothetical protein
MRSNKRGWYYSLRSLLLIRGMLMPMNKETPWILAVLLLVGGLITLASQNEPKADTPRHIDFTQVIKDLDGKPLPINMEGKLPAVATLGQVAKDALVNVLQEDAQLPGSVKYDHWVLAGKIYPDKSDVVLTAEELATIKERIGKAFGPLVVGPCWKLLDPATKGASK